MLASQEDATNQETAKMTATAANIAGFIMKQITATSTEYSTLSRVPVLIDEFGEFEFDVDTGTADINDEDGFIDVDDTAPDDAVDVEASTEDHIKVTRYISGTLVRGRVAVWSHLQAPVIR